jgi:hypothetical protein
MGDAFVSGYGDVGDDGAATAGRESGHWGSLSRRKEDGDWEGAGGLVALEPV